MRRPRIALVGQAPARVMFGDAPFSGRTGKRIAEMAGVEFEKLGNHFALFNLIPYWPGRQGKKGDAFPMAEALCKEVIALTMYAELAEETQATVVAAVNRLSSRPHR